MCADLNTRKPVVEITAADLRLFPIWEYALDEEGVDEQDETWIRPIDRKTVRKNVYSQLVAARFTTQTAVELDGFMIVSTAGGKVAIQPGAIVGNFGYECLPSAARERAEREGLSWVIEERDAVAHALGAEEQDIFPMTYELKALLPSEKVLRKGTIE